ncbi:MAG: DUF3971 domain-containing protein [Alphaproteobacteria bacterium]|nr:DUF3971 domain-containing protein [Alphaproteobacteria bacterium]
MRRVARLAVLYVLEALAALLALAIFGGAALLWRLAEGPLDAEAFRPAATEALLSAVDADIASIGSLEVSFDPAAAALVVTALDVSAARAGGEVVVSAPRVETALALDLLMTGRAAPVRITASGGSFTLLRAVDGRLYAGLGGPDAVRGQNSGEGPGGGRLGAFASGLDSQGSGPLSRLREIDLRDVDLRVIDEASDLSLIFQDARAQLTLDETGLAADLSGGLITGAGLSPVALRLEAGRDLASVFVDLRIRDLVPATAAPLRGAFARLAAVDAPMALDLVLDASAEQGLRTALVELRAEPGTLRAGGRSFALNAAQLSVVLDADAGALDINKVRIESDLIDLDITGRIFDLSRFDGALPTQAAYEIESAAGAFDWPGLFPESLVWNAASIAGRLDSAAPRIEFDRLDIDLPSARAELEGRIALSQTDAGLLPDIQLTGPIRGMLTKADILRHWPVDFALGARDWVRDSILAGDLSNARLDLNIPVSALAARALEDEHLNLSFAFSDADVRYMSTMTPLTGLSGEAVLRGNSLSLTGRDGAIGDLQIDTIFVEAPRLNPKGAPARFGGTGRGPVQAVLGLLAQPPLNLDDNYGIDPSAFEGEGTMSFEISRPMLRSVPPEDLGYSASGRFESVSAPSGFEGVRLQNGVVEIEADEQGLTADGVADLAGARTQIQWRETFGLGDDADSSQVTLSTLMTARGLDQLGLPLRRFLDGAVGVEGVVTGRGFDFRTVSLALDLEQAAVALPADLWEKAPGEPGAAAFEAEFPDEGGVALRSLSVDAAALTLRADAEIAADGRLAAANVQTLDIPGRMDLAFTADRPEGLDGVLRLQLTGDYLDAGELFSIGAPGAGLAINAPVALEAAIARVLVRDVGFTGVGLTARLGPDGLEQASLSARTQDSEAPVELSFAPEPDAPGGPRRLRVETGDAGAVLTALAGYDNAAGGNLRIDAMAPPAGGEGPIEGELIADAFVLERMPLLARVLAAGSLEGLAGLLGGQGIGFDQLDGRFVWQDSTLEMRDGRVVGPALGVTWTGIVDFEDPRIEVDGTILPSYGVNSVLGSLPVFGELFTGRQGEGVIGVTFTASGPFDQTRVTANPLSALAPGVFRRMFEGTSAERELEALEARRRELQPGPDAVDDPDAPKPNEDAPANAELEPEGDGPPPDEEG